MARRMTLRVLCLAGFLGHSLAGGGEAATDNWYIWRLSGQPCGYFHMARKSSGDKGAPVLLVNEFVIQARGRRMSLKMETFCKDDAFLTPVRIVSKGEGDDELLSFDAAIDWGAGDGGLLSTEARGRKVELRLPEGTVTDFALFEVVRGLAFDKAAALEFHSLEASELNLKREHKIAYLGEQEVALGEGKKRLHAFEHTGRGIRPAHFWLDASRRLVRVVIDGRKEFLLATRDDAMNAIEGAAAGGQR